MPKKLPNLPRRRRHPSQTSSYEPVLKADKGKFGGSCNRTACQAPGAEWYNHGTRLYYCQRCAHWLNTDKFNRADAQRMFGHDLCTRGEHKAAA